MPFLSIYLSIGCAFAGCILFCIYFWGDTMAEELTVREEFLLRPPFILLIAMILIMIWPFGVYVILFGWDDE